MVKHPSKPMNSKITTFSILALAAIFAMALPLDYALAQNSDVSSDSEEGESRDGGHEGKSCPFKDKKTASVNTGLNT